jgi:hypothetical protein
MQCQSQKIFLRKRKFVTSEVRISSHEIKGDTVVFDTQGNVFSAEIPSGYLYPVDAKTVTSTTDGRKLTTFNLETGDEKRARKVFIEDLIVIGDWVYLISQTELWKIKKDLTGRGQKSPEITRFHPGGGFSPAATAEIGGNIAELNNEGVLRILDTQTLRFFRTYNLTIAGQKFPQFLGMKKLNDKELVVKLDTRFFILNIETGHERELKGIPRASSSISLQYRVPSFDTFQGKNGLLFVISSTSENLRYALDIFSSKDNYGVRHPLLVGDPKNRLHLVEVLDEHHLIVITMAGKAQLLEFSLEPSVSTKVLCEWMLMSDVGKIVEIPLSDEENDEENLRLVKELESVTPSASAILGIVAGFL